MSRDAVTPIFVPRAFGEGVTTCEVVSCLRGAADGVSRGETLVELRGGRVRAVIESPLSGTVTQLYVRVGETAHVGEMLAEIAERAPERRRGESGSWLVARAPGVLAVALAAPVLVWPFAWLAATVVALAIVGAFSLTRLGAGRRLRTSLRRVPRIVAGVVGCVLLAILVPALVGGASWLLSHGGDGLSSAVRLAVAGYAGRLFAAIACLWLWWRALRAPGPRAAIRGRAAQLPEIGLTVLALLACGWVAACAVVIPREAWWPYADFQGVVEQLPSALGDQVHETRGDLARTEADAVTACLAEHGRGGWRPSRVWVRSDGSLLLGLRAEAGQRQGPRRVGTLMLALNNQLAPLGDVTVAIAPGKGAETIEFEPLRARLPTVEPAAIGAPAVNDRDLEVALACSAAAL